VMMIVWIDIWKHVAKLMLSLQIVMSQRLL